MSNPAQPGGPPPWINHDMQRRIPWRDQDIVISVPVKSGTTWTMNIVHQLLSGGDADFLDIYAEVLWLEFVNRPGMPVEELIERVARMPADRPRAFKMHSAPPELDYVAPGADRDVRYVVVMRNPEEALVSMKHFLDQHSDAWFELWQIPRAAIVRPDFESFYRDVAEASGMNRGLFEFLNGWWPLRHQPNVLCMHYADMTRDHEGTLRRVADFIGVTPDAASWAAIREYTSFAWMKRHNVKFDGVTLGETPILNPGAMVRKGQAGGAHADGMTATIAADLRALGASMCPDERALRWFYTGGTLPP
ncbi:MAG: sulfotransferase domain-containing protein [Gammaproteobacteria bacterium]